MDLPTKYNIKYVTTCSSFSDLQILLTKTRLYPYLKSSYTSDVKHGSKEICKV